MSVIDVDIAVIGGGPAATAAARAAARADMAVALIEAEHAGGRAARTTSLPLRMLARAAEAESEWAAARAAIDERGSAWSERLAMTLDDAGVELVRGRARFSSPTSLALDDGRVVRFERAVIATGAEPARLPGAAPDGTRICTPDDFWRLPALPNDAMVIGGGPAGAEIVEVLSRFGTRVTWVMDELGILPTFDRELAEAVGDVLMNRGVKLVHGKAVEALSTGEAGAMAKLEGGRTYAAPVAIVAAGNRARVVDLDLPAAGLAPDARGAIRVDDRCRTAAPHLYAAGDVTASIRGVAGAEAMGRVAGCEAAGVSGPPFEPELVPQVAYTRPQIAQVGLTADAAAGREVIFHTLRLEETLGGFLAKVGEHPDDKGFVRLVCDSESGRLLGASALGEGAADAVSAAALALRLGATEGQLARGAAAIPGALDALVRAVR